MDRSQPTEKSQKVDENSRRTNLMFRSPFGPSSESVVIFLTVQDALISLHLILVPHDTWKKQKR